MDRLHNGGTFLSVVQEGCTRGMIFFFFPGAQSARVAKRLAKKWEGLQKLEK